MADAVTLTHLAAGAYHDHHVLRVEGRAVVLRRCTASQWGLAPAAQLAREHATLVALAATGVAPAPLALLDDPPLLLEEHVAGRPFSYASDLPALGRALVRVHALAPAHLPAVDARAELLADGAAWLARAREAGTDGEATALVARLGERAAASAEAAGDGPPVLVHTDLNAGNLLATDDGVRLLDWEAARRGPPGWDLAHALAPTTTRWDAGTACALTTADARSLLDAYVDAGGDPRAATAAGALMGVVVFRALAWCLGARGERALGRRAAAPALDAALARLTGIAAVREALAFADGQAQ